MTDFLQVTSFNPLIVENNTPGTIPGPQGPAGPPTMDAGTLTTGTLAEARLPDLSATYATQPAGTETTIYVSTGIKANDTNDGLTLGKPKATIASALAALGTGPGIVQLGGGTFTISASDAHGNGVTLALIGQRLRGAGFGISTQLVIDTNATWGIQATAGYCSVEDIYVTIAAGRTVTYGVGVSTPASTGSAQHCQFSRVFVNILGTVTAAFALGPDWPGSSAVDIANTVFDHCIYSVTGAATHGWLSGNGTSGNVTANTARACVGVGSQYGITLNGSGFQMFGGGFARCTSADIHIPQAHGGGFYFFGLRCENGNQALNTSYGGPGGPVVLDGCSFDAYTPTAVSAGEIVTHNLTAGLILIGGSYTTTGVNTSFHVNDSTGSPARPFMALGVKTDTASPYPAAGAKVSRVILGAVQVVSGNPTPNPSVSCTDGFSTPYDTTQPTLRVGGDQAGAVTVKVGSDATAGTQSVWFKSSGGLPPNFDSRLVATGGTSTDGNGGLQLYGASFTINALARPGTDATWDLGSTSLRWRNGLFSSYVKIGAVATGSRPSASTAGAGACMFDTTLGKPIWSNGTIWVDATGTTV
jgi:hypothetical protein